MNLTDELAPDPVCFWIPPHGQVYGAEWMAIGAEAQRHAKLVKGRQAEITTADQFP